MDRAADRVRGGTAMTERERSDPRIASPFEIFELERWQSSHEQDVRYELADSGVPAITLAQLAALGLDLDALADLPLHYPEVNGTALLRERIAALYPGAGPSQVLVTVGAAEAGAVAIDALTRPGERIAFMRPNYQQLAGLARNRRCEIASFSLDADASWTLREEELVAAARGAALIAVSNPNNPTGHVLGEQERRLLVEVAREQDAWLLCDEVYIGTEHDGDETASLWGAYERTVVISSLSKAYGLAGLRLGWVIGPEHAVAACWRRHEYATIATSAPSMAVAEFALERPSRAALFARSREYIAAGHVAIAAWARSEAALGVRLAGSRATPVAFVGLPPGVSSVTFALRLVREADVLVAPGEYFGGYDDRVRITAARRLDELEPALALITAMLASVAGTDGERR